MIVFGVLIASLCVAQISAEDDLLPYSIDDVIRDNLPTNETSFFSDGEDIVRVDMDMLFTREDYAKLMEEESLPHSQRMKRKALRNTNSRWTNKQPVYSINTKVFSSSNIRLIEAGIAEWEKYTCLKFKKRTNERNYIHVTNGGGCSSFVGMRGGSQRLSLDRGCRRHSTIVHEFGHAIGFHHEQCRPDRDSFITVNTGNIQSGKAFNFNKYSTSRVNNHGVTYDYRSVMHYGARAFSRNFRNTITTKDSSYQNVIGRAPGLSFRDIKMANLMYSCNSHCAAKTCPGEGFVGKDCVCYCPSGNTRSPLKKCDGDGPGPTNSPPPTSAPGTCRDLNERCQEWADRGECTKNPRYMLINCKKACDTCQGGKNCRNDNERCEEWANRGECTKTPNYMKVFCRQACKEC